MGWPTDGLAAFFLVCFFVGLLYTVASFLLGLGHGIGGHAAGGGPDHGHLHLEDLQVKLPGGSHGSLEAGHADGPNGGPAGGHGATGSSASPGPAKAGFGLKDGGPSPLNLSTLMAFLTWFGGAGYILRAYYGAWLLVALAVAGVAGLAGAALVFVFLSKVLHASERVLDPRDYYLPGTLARVTSSLRPGGTGEIVYTKGDTRQVAGARSVDGQAIERGTEVVIMRYERGLAYVQRWEDLMRSEEGTDESSVPSGR